MPPEIRLSRLLFPNPPPPFLSRVPGTIPVGLPIRSNSRRCIDTIDLQAALGSKAAKTRALPVVPPCFTSPQHPDGSSWLNKVYRRSRCCQEQIPAYFLFTAASSPIKQLVFSLVRAFPKPKGRSLTIRWWIMRDAQRNRTPSRFEVDKIYAAEGGEGVYTLGLRRTNSRVRTQRQPPLANSPPQDTTRAGRDQISAAAMHPHNPLHPHPHAPEPPSAPNPTRLPNHAQNSTPSCRNAVDRSAFICGGAAAATTIPTSSAAS